MSMSAFGWRPYPPVAPTLEVVEWNEEVRRTEMKKSFRHFWPEPGGKAVVSKLLSFLEKSLGNPDSECWVLLLTDGAFPEGDFGDFESWANGRTGLTLRVVAVGPDADVRNLRRLSDLTPFLPEEIESAVDSFFTTWDLETSPIDLTDILLAEEGNSV